MHQENNNGEPETHVSREEARAGSSNKENRNALGISLPLVILLLAVVIAVGFWMTSMSGADNVNVDNQAATSQAATSVENRN